MTFNVLIIGGSITGLTLAAILERYGIQYTLLEKHDTVAPSLGASIGLLAHGSRVLEQLGCFAELLPFGTGVEDMEFYGPDGKHLATHAKLGSHLDSMLGYTLFFVERQRVLNALWGAIADKSKIHLSSSVANIEPVNGGVQVKTRDGRVFTGSIVVGGDCVHSKSREEMWRLTEAVKCDITSDRKAIKTAQTCIFGISHGPPQVKPKQTSQHVQQDRHYILSEAPNGLTFWFVFFKNRKKATSWDAIRYSDEETQELVTEFATDQIRPGMTFADHLYRTTTTTAVVSLEEFVLQRYYYKRMLLLGVSVHKMHPITGQGGNVVIEDCAFLANRLKDLIANGSPTDAQLQDIFHELQEERRPRTEMLAKGARELARLESFATPLLKLMMLHIFPTVPCEDILPGICESMTQGEPLKYLPLPLRSKKLVPYDDEVRVTRQGRSTLTSYIWICLFLLLASIHLIPFQVVSSSTVGNLETTSSIFASPWQSNTAASYLAVNAFWAIESYRAALTPGPLLSSIPWILLAKYLGWYIALPAYFSLWIHGTRCKGLYYPWPRAIPAAAAEALPIALLLVASAEPWLVKLRASSALLARIDSLTLTQISFPLLASVIKYGLGRTYGARWEPVYQWGNYDMTYTARFFASAFVISGISHAYFVSQIVVPAILHGSVLPLTQDVIDFGTFAVLIASWLLFTVWDLRCVKVTDFGLGKAVLYIILGMLLVGPGGALTAAWWWRERLREKCGQRQSHERYSQVKMTV
ncbi:hypothetical protein BDW59DRAFT_160871 [Aspergillus cavernicola]|uniref:FAD-binding domain-containing protein n=1 Tax=Aspergillus cavernicola TaxID=176166 RepID=A0ABR4IHH2_9EURO